MHGCIPSLGSSEFYELRHRVVPVSARKSSGVVRKATFLYLTSSVLLFAVLFWAGFCTPYFCAATIFWPAWLVIIFENGEPLNHVTCCQWLLDVSSAGNSLHMKGSVIWFCHFDIHNFYKEAWYLPLTLFFLFIFSSIFQSVLPSSRQYRHDC